LVHIGVKKCSPGGSSFLLIFLRRNVIFCRKTVKQRKTLQLGGAL